MVIEGAFSHLISGIEKALISLFVCFLFSFSLNTTSWTDVNCQALNCLCRIVLVFISCSINVLQVQTTSPDSYQVTPHRGCIEPGNVANVTIKCILGIC